MSEAHRPSWKWWVCAALLMATMLNYMDRQTLALTATELKTLISLDDQRYGTLDEWFSYAFAVGGIFFGLVADRIGPRRLYPIVLVGWSIAGMITPLASYPAVANALGDPESPGLGEYRWMLICRTTLGLFEAGHWPCALLTARNVLSAEQRPLGNSILQSGASMGAILTPFVLELVRATGAPWQAPFVVIGVGGLLWVPLWFKLIRPDDLHRNVNTKDHQAPARPVGILIFQFVCLAIVVISISLAWQFQRAWLPKFLKEHHHYSETTANRFTSAYYMVADVGCLLCGALVSAIIARGVHVRWARIICMALCAGLIALSAAVPYLEKGPFLLIALALVGAGALGAHPQYYALVQELPQKYMATLGGMLTACSWVSVGQMQGAIGLYIKETKSYDFPLVFTGLTPLAALTAMTAWALVSHRPSTAASR